MDYRGRIAYVIFIALTIYSLQVSAVQQDENDEGSSPFTLALDLLQNQIKCMCKKKTVMKTSWSNKNPGRRFWACPNRGCSYFSWIDGEICARATQIIPGLLARINNMEVELTKKEKQNYNYEGQTRENATQLKEKIVHLEAQIKSKNATVRKQRVVILLLCLIIFIMWVIMGKDDDEKIQLQLL